MIKLIVKFSYLNFEDRVIETCVLSFDSIEDVSQEAIEDKLTKEIAGLDRGLHIISIEQISSKA